jgi:glycosyltransferase involved in cell wall biosynthesis
MKIALVTSSFLPNVGGAELVVHHLANTWTKQGHNVWVINPNADKPTHPEAKYKTLKYTFLRGSSRFGFHKFPFCQYAVWGIKKCLDRIEPDFISAHFAFPTGYFLSLIRPRIGYVVTAHGSDITTNSWSFRTIYNCDTQILQALERSNYAIAISEQAAEIFREIGLNKNKIVNIPNGVELERFVTMPGVDIRDKFNIGKDELLVLSIGRNAEAKNYALGLKAFKLFWERFSRARYLMLGRNITDLTEEIARLKIMHRVILCEDLQGEELIAAYQQADIFFSCSKQEMFPLVTLEAMASGLPIVVTNVGGNQQLAENGKNGFIVGSRDVVGMADALFNIAADASLRRHMSGNSRMIVQDYSWESVSKRYLQL